MGSHDEGPRGLSAVHVGPMPVFACMLASMPCMCMLGRMHAHRVEGGGRRLTRGGGSVPPFTRLTLPALAPQVAGQHQGRWPAGAGPAACAACCRLHQLAGVAHHRCVLLGGWRGGWRGGMERGVAGMGGRGCMGDAGGADGWQCQRARCTWSRPTPWGSQPCVWPPPSLKPPSAVLGTCAAPLPSHRQ